MWVKSIWFALSISSKPKRTRLGNMGQIEGAADWGHSFFDPKGPRKEKPEKKMCLSPSSRRIESHFCGFRREKRWSWQANP